MSTARQRMFRRDPRKQLDQSWQAWSILTWTDYLVARLGLALDSHRDHDPSPRLFPFFYFICRFPCTLNTLLGKGGCFVLYVCISFVSLSINKWNTREYIQSFIFWKKNKNKKTVRTILITMKRIKILDIMSVIIVFIRLLGSIPQGAVLLPQGRSSPL